MTDVTHRSDLKAALARIKQDAGSHSPSIATIQRELPEVTVNIDACFLSNPYATDLFLDYFTHELVSTGKLRRVVEYYPSQNGAVARRIARRLDVAPERVFVGNGAVEIIQAILHNFCEHTLMLNLPTFSPYYEFVRPGTRVVYHQLPKERHFALDVEAYLDEVRRERPDTVVLINPNNPDGGYLPMADVRAILHAMRDVPTVILDESFVHFAFEDELLTPVTFAALCDEYPNLIIVKSMSKDFGIAGIRAGYAIMDEAKVRRLLANGFLWNSSGLAEYFFDLWGRDEFARQYDMARTRYVREAQHFFEQLHQLPHITMYPSRANFALIELPHGLAAFDFVSHLLIEHGIYTRGCGDKRGLHGEFVRIAARTAVENQHILHGIRDVTGSVDDAAARTVGGNGHAPTQAQPATTPPLISRAEVLSGMTGRVARQASSLLALIRNQTAHLAAQNRQTMDQLVTGARTVSPPQAFFAALLLGRERSDAPTIDELERYAPQWAELVPENPLVRAATAHYLAREHSFTHPATPRLRAALGLDTPAVQEAFQRLYAQPLATIYAAEAPPLALETSTIAALQSGGAAETLGLRVVPTNRLLPHEHHDPQRAARLAERITGEGALANPPLVVALPDGERYMVLDGATRTTAFAQLGYPHIVVQVVDPQGSTIHLNTWFHAIRGTSAADLVREVRGIGGLQLTQVALAEAPSALWDRSALGYLVTADYHAFVMEHAATPDGPDWLHTLTRLVDRYGAWGRVERTLEDDVHTLGRQYPDLAGLAVFPQLPLDLVMQLVDKGRLLPAGLTRFLVSGRVLRLNVPLALLTSDELIAQKTAWLDQFVQAKLARGGLRHYGEPVIMLDE